MSCLNPVYILDSAYADKNNVLLETIHRLTKGTKAWHHFQGLLHRIPVPCGKCINCLMAKKRMWMYRVDCELRMSKAAFFYTLTYDDLITPSPPTGVQKVHAQNFMKYLRKNLGDLYGRVRFYLCGEYGGKYRRPHYHVLLFFPDKIISKETLTPIVLQSWKHGQIADGYVEQLSASYCAKDMLKLDDPELYEACKNGYLNEPFSLYSRRPGLGGLFAEKYRDHFSKRDPFNCTVFTNGSKLPLPRYFRTKFFPERVWDEVHSQEYQNKMNAAAIRQYNTQVTIYKKRFGSLEGFDDWYFSNDGEVLKQQLKRNTKSKL